MLFQAVMKFLSNQNLVYNANGPLFGSVPFKQEVCYITVILAYGMHAPRLIQGVQKKGNRSSARYFI